MRFYISFWLLTALIIDPSWSRASPTPTHGDPRLGSHDHDRLEAFTVRARRRGVAQAAPFERRAIAETKYFHEPGGNELLGHYDIRYFKELDTYENRQETQLHMIRAYLEFFQEKGLETWLAHGTLLGWWWNEKMLPWDWDIDTQVSEATLRHMGDHLNSTIHHYTAPSTLTGEDVTNTYLLDVNPESKQRTNGDGQNIIDARWIDISNGLYIDITGLSELNPQSQPGILQCKNYHRYATDQLFPMRETMFEGVVAKVPYSYTRILMVEYQKKALTETIYEGHEFHSEDQLWIKLPETIEKEEEERQKQEEEKRKKEEEKFAETNMTEEERKAKVDKEVEEAEKTEEEKKNGDKKTS